LIDEPMQIESGGPADIFGSGAMMTNTESFEEQPCSSVTVTT